MEATGVQSSPEAPADEPLLPREALIAHLSLVDRVTAQICKRRRLTSDEAEEFAAHVRMKLVENEYGLWARCCEAASLRTYLLTVIDRLFLDYRTSQWGRWRPSAGARRGGEVAILLDRLLTRDGFTFDEACQVLETNYGVRCSRDDLYAMSVRLPLRTMKRTETAALDDLAARDGDPEESLTREEARRRAECRNAALRRAIERLAPEDRRLLEMRYRLGRSVVTIARELGVPAKPLYSRLEHIVRGLRRAVKADAAAVPDEPLTIGEVSICWE